MLIKESLSQAIQDVIDGKANPLEVWEFLKDIQDHLNKCKQEIEPLINKIQNETV
jgi:hypothetical protein